MPIKTRALAFMGTGSDVGKSLLVAGLCRLWHNKGYKIAPFKPQNMANNAMVADDGGEVGRAQALQAKAARIPLSHHSNPILLKPQAGNGSQVIVHGKNIGFMPAKEYYKHKKSLLSKACESFEILQKKYDIIIMEGAGSPAEVNLRRHDIANMGFAQIYNIPSILVADIERGGAIASIIGHKYCLSPKDRGLIKGYIINKFRGDASLLAPAYQFMQQKTAWHHAGTIPHFGKLSLLPQEDSMALSQMKGQYQGRVKIAIPIPPHLANFDDANPLINHPSAEVILVRAGMPIPICDWVVMLGSKSTISDGQFYIGQGWHHDIISHYQRGGRVMGICGGMQLLGLTISDEQKIDGITGQFAGLGLLPIHTTMQEQKIVQLSTAIETLTQSNIEFYEIHCGISRSERPLSPFIQGRDLGFISDDRRVIGCYCHGLFDNAGFLQQFLSSDITYHYQQQVDNILDEWANIIESHCDSHFLEIQFG